MGPLRHWRAAVLIVGLLLAPACGDDAAPKATTPSKSGSTTTLANSKRPLTSGSTTTVAKGNGKAASAGPIDMSKVPDFTVSTLSGVSLVSKGKVHSIKVDTGVRILVSPDGRHVAAATMADAVRSARLEIIDVVTGRQEHAFDVDTKSVNLLDWSPDSSAVVASYQSGPTGSIKTVLTVFRRDGSQVDAAPNEPNSSGAVGQNPHWYIGKDGAAYGAECSLAGYPNGVCLQTQLVTSKHEPVLLVSDGTQFGRWDPATKSITRLTDEKNTSVKPCGRYGVLSVRGELLAYDADTGRSAPAPRITSECPVQSPSGTRLAFSGTDGPVVVDLSSGTATNVAREGAPMAWSTDESSLLIASNAGSFVVAADGSGGKETSVRLSAMCVGGTAGKVVAQSQADRKTVIYDIGADSAEVLDGAALSQGTTCAVTTEGSWTQFNRSLFDVRSGTAGPLSVRAEDGSDVGAGTFTWAIDATVRRPGP